ncbi:pilus assembly protein TadG-related protein [Streptomyces zaomyceticus]|uniref:pilus assembly protein TadG-related protein n=1 Tax=Streptomyces zaomyceticus TaxID=68286 RepID=UPI003429405A
MTRARRRGDAGQAFPLYIAVVGGLLLLAFAYFAVGQAAVNRSGAQTAADAAALAAAQHKRDQLADAWIEALGKPSVWPQILDGTVEGLRPSCLRANALATRNDAHVISCRADGPLAYTVTVEPDKSMGSSVLPGTEGKRFAASARAVVDPLCTSTSPAEDAPPDAMPRLTCGDKEWDVDTDLLVLPEPQDLFAVHLAD